MRAPASMPGHMVFGRLFRTCSIFVTERLKKRGWAAPHPAPLGLADSRWWACFSPGLGKFPMPTSPNFRSSTPTSRPPVRPPAVPLLSAALPGPVRSSEWSACTTLSGSCLPVPLQSIAPPQTPVSGQAPCDTASNVAGALHIHSLLRLAVAATAQFTLITALSAPSCPLSSPLAARVAMRCEPGRFDDNRMFRRLSLSSPL